MKEKVFHFIGAVFLTILALLGIGAVLHILLTLPFEGKGPEWVGAIGTVATLIGTIYIARTETRRRERSEQLLAELHAEAILFKIGEVDAVTKTVHETMGKFAKVNPDFVQLQALVIHLRDIQGWPPEDLAPIAPLSGTAVVNLTRATGMLNLIHRLITPSLLDGRQGEARKQAENLAILLGKLNEYLRAADKHLRKNRRLIQ